MTTERLDIGPKEWIAAEGEALLQVNVRRGLSVSISLEPVRDVRISRAKFIEGYWEPISFLFLLLWGGYGYTRHISTGEVNPFLGTVFLVSAFALYGVVVAMAYRRKDRVTLRFGRGGNPRSDCLDIPDNLVNESETVAFLERLARLSSAAPDQRRERRRYSIDPWWGTLTALLVAMAAIVALILWLIDAAQPVHAVLLALTIGAGLLLASAERSLLFHRPLRRAQSLLLYDEVDSAERILKEFLIHRPTHARGNYLMTVAELLRGDMQLAQELVIQDPVPGICHNYFISRFQDYHLWGSRHADH